MNYETRLAWNALLAKLKQIGQRIIMDYIGFRRAHAMHRKQTSCMWQRLPHFFAGGCTLQCLLQIASRKHQIQYLKTASNCHVSAKGNPTGMCSNILGMFHTWIWSRQERSPSAIFLCTKSSQDNPCRSTFLPRKTSLRELLPQRFRYVSRAILQHWPGPIQRVEAKQPRN